MLMIVRATNSPLSPSEAGMYWKRGALRNRCGWRETATISAWRTSAQNGGSCRSLRKTGASRRSRR